MVVSVVAAVVTAGVSSLATALAVDVIGAGLAATVIGGVAGAMVAGAVMGAIMPGAKSATQAQQASGILINGQSNVDAIPVIYGSRKVGGTRVFVGVSGSSNEYLSLVIVLGEGPVSAINNVYLDGTVSTDARFSGLVTITKHLGTPGDAADAGLIASCPAQWTSAHKLANCAYLVVKLKYDQNAFTGIPTITADVDGRTLFDPRTSTTIFSNNPALCIRDYLTNAMYGRGLAAGMIDDASFIAAANYFDTTVTIPGGTQARYTCTGSVDTGQTAYNNIQSLLTSCRSFLIFTGGVYSIKPDKVTASTFDFTEDNITGSWTIKQPGKADKFNRVTSGYFNPAKNWQPDIEVYDSAAFRTVDNGMLLELPLQLDFTANTYTANQLAQMALNQSRFGIVCQFSAFQQGLRCEVGDVVTITHSTPGWAAKLFRVLQIEIKSTDEVMITAQEYDASVYSFATLVPANVAPATNLPNVYSVPAPSGLTLSSGTADLLTTTDGTVLSRIHASWALPANQFVLAGGGTELQFKRTADTLWLDASAPDSTQNSAYIAPVKDGTAYDVRARFRNSMGVRGAWSTVLSYTVIGKTASPSDVSALNVTVQPAGVLLTWAAVADVDVSKYEIRTTSAWSGSFVATVQGTQLALPPQAVGATSWCIKAVDSSGNYSVNSVAGTLTVSAPSTPAPISVQVIDNSVLLYWTAATATQAIRTYEIRKGATWAGATVIGKKDGLFTLVQETQGGTFTYWVAAIDIAGNYGTPLSATVSVSAPPDYLLKSNFDSVFAGIVVNGVVDSYGVTMPVDTAQTFNAHFTTPGWATPAAQIAAGYAIYAEPSNLTGSYTEAIDYGATLTGCKITAAYAGTALDGTPSTSCDIMTSTLFAQAATYSQTGTAVTVTFTAHGLVAGQQFEHTVTTGTGVSGLFTVLTAAANSFTYTAATSLTTSGNTTITRQWVLYAGATQVYAPAFRYVKVRVNVTAVAAAMYRLVSLNIRVDVKLKNDGGSISWTANPTAAVFNLPFIAVTSIVLTVMGSTGNINSVTDFVSVPNPTGFNVYLFTANTGAAPAGPLTVAWSAKGY